MNIRTCPVCLIDETTTDDLDFHIAMNHSTQDIAEFSHDELINTASIVADPNATFDERLAVAENLFSDLMIKLDEIEENGS